MCLSLRLWRKSKIRVSYLPENVALKETVIVKKLDEILDQLRVRSLSKTQVMVIII